MKMYVIINIFVMSLDSMLGGVWLSSVIRANSLNRFAVTFSSLTLSRNSSGAAERAFRTKRSDRVGALMSIIVSILELLAAFCDVRKQQFLYLRPLPQGQGWFLPTFIDSR
jgi:hypothetical protein